MVNDPEWHALVDDDVPEHLSAFDLTLKSVVVAAVDLQSDVALLAALLFGEQIVHAVAVDSRLPDVSVPQNVQERFYILFQN